MADMFGSPVGDVAGIKANQDLAETQKIFGDIAMQPARQRLLDAQAQKEELAVANERRWQEALISRANGGMPADPNASISAQFNDMAQLAMGSGNVKKATDLARAAAYIGSATARADGSRAMAEEHRINSQIKSAQFAGQLFGGVEDQDSWDRANAMYQFNTGRVSPYAHLPYSKTLIDRITAESMSAKDRLELRRRELRDEQRAYYEEERLDQIDTAQSLRRQAEERKRKWDEQRAKNGGAGAVQPNKDNQLYVSDLIGKEFPDMAPADRNQASFDIAAQARILMRNNRALDAGTALSQAYQSAKEAGDLQGPPEKANWWDSRQKSTYMKAGKTPQDPLPLPMIGMGKDAKVKTKDMVKGRYYTINGRVGQWTGTGMKPVAGGAAPQGSGAPALIPDIGGADDAEDDDDNEEE